MRNSEIAFNSLNFIYSKSETIYYFSSKKFFNSHPFSISILPPQLIDRLKISSTDEYVYCGFERYHPNTTPFPISFEEYPAFAQRLLHIKILNHFSNKGFINTLSFIDGVMIYIEEKSKSNTYQSVYSSFELRVTATNKSIILLVSYCGEKSISKLTLQEMVKCGVESSDIAYIIHDNRILKFSNEVKVGNLDWSQCYVKLNRVIRDKLNYLPNTVVEKSKKYTTYLTKIEYLLKEELSTKEFLEIFPHSTRWISTSYQNSKKVFIINTSQGKRLFGNNRADSVLYDGLKKFGPYKKPPFGNYTFIYIYQNNDIDRQQKLENILGVQLTKLIGLNYSLNPTLDIIYSSETNPYPEIKEQLRTKVLNPQTTYVAIYLAPYDKNSCTEEQSANYYRIKELLLQNHMVSQVIDRGKINNSNFNFYIPNIAVSLCAKLGGIPWLDDSILKDELVIGIGAYRSKNSLKQYIGNACAFSSNGLFQGFKAFPSTEIYVLAGKLAKAIQDYIVNGKTLKRIIIHFYKVMSDKEMQPIEEMLNSMSVNIPIIIITINKTVSHDHLIFDTASENKMPLHATAVNFKDNQWLLCNNERYYNESITSKGKFPLKIRFTCKNNEMIDVGFITKDYLPQIISFSKLYWKSISHQSHPVTMLYPEMVADFYQHFESPLFDSNYESVPWFL